MKEKEFLHYLYDTVILLGGGKAVGNMVKRCENGNITDDDIDALRDINIQLINNTKDKLVNMNTMEINGGSK